MTQYQFHTDEQTDDRDLDVASSLLARYIQLRLGPMRAPEQVFRALLSHHIFYRANDSEGSKNA
jgi:hypothetical protein